jgi:hypothetical protein
MYKNVRVRFGQFILAFLCNSQETIDFLKFYFNKYISNSSPSVSIIINVIPQAKPSFIESDIGYMYSVNKEKFTFGEGLIQGSWDAERKTCHLSISKSLLKPDLIWLFSRFLCRLFYTLLMEEKNEKKKVIIIHSSGILKNKKGYIFFGPPKSGKSTIAYYSSKFEVLHDDMNLVTISGKGASLEGVPFNPRHLDFSNSSGPLSMMCSLHKNDTVKIERGTPEEFAKMALIQVFMRLPLLFEDRKGIFQYLLSCIKKLGKTIPYYRLYFKNDSSFWDIIDKAEEDYARY